MASQVLHHLPIVDDNGTIVGLECLSPTSPQATRDNVVVLMAGGEGRRLLPLTSDTPKPLLEVGNRPILESILEGFVGFGFSRFYVSVNYMAEALTAHFGDGSKWNVDIQYLREEEPLGTGGALSLLPTRPATPIIVMNGDLLTNVNFEHLLRFHATRGAAATMCVRQHEVQVPFGVAEVVSDRLVHFEEKPVSSYFVNAGVYVLEPATLDLIPQGEYFDMPWLFRRLLETNETVTAFPIREYWRDIGQHADLERANGEYSDVFS
jgi:NDP-sugar pyrophosphorylase family protein